MGHIHEALKKAGIVGEGKRNQSPPDGSTSTIDVEQVNRRSGTARDLLGVLPQTVLNAVTPERRLELIEIASENLFNEAQLRPDPRLVAFSQPRSLACEQYRVLRTKLIHAAQKDSVQVIVITSASIEEGKTTTSINLAQIMAQNKDSRTLLIEADLRRAQICQKLGLNARLPRGLTGVLRGQCEPEDAIIKLEPYRLYILPVENHPDNPAELLTSRQMGQVLNKLRAYFDFILIDTPPLIPVTDPNVVINLADGFILVIRANVTPYRLVESALSRIGSGNVLGVVLNGADTIAPAGYSYYYRYAERDRDK